MVETPTPETPSLFDPTLPPSSSLLFYLYAERVLPAALWGTKAPLAAVRVNTQRLACALFAVAFWQLREPGLLRLELAQERRLLKTSTHLRVARASLGQDGRRDGIEGGILDVLTPGSRGKLTPAWESLPQWLNGWGERFEGTVAELSHLPNPPIPVRNTPKAPPATVTDVVARWYGRSVRSPERLPIGWTEREGIAKGYLAVVDAHRNPLAALVLGKTDHVPQREQVAALEPRFAQLLGRWQAFQANEAVLADQLERDIAAGISACAKNLDSSSGG